MIEIDYLEGEHAPCTEPCRLEKIGGGASAASSIPLRSRSVQGTIFAEHSFCEVTEELCYVADAEDCSVRFVFPLPPRSAVFR